ncbi:MAG TPA: hypothetical protein VMP11_07870 [Verrucomicrobiae bacterium]|nr:hypothetical protein [Verrucomicrobiae bacterium]
MKWLFRITVVAIIVFALWQAWEWLFVTDEMRIQRQISIMSSAAEKGDLMKLSNAVASDYGDDWGLDKSTLLGAVQSYHAQYSPIFIHISDLKVTVDPDRQKAQAIFIAKIIARARGSASESEAREDRFRLYFRKTDSGWELTRAESPALKFD